jgi:hypothetical protein
MNDLEAKTAAAAIHAVLTDMLKEASSHHGSLATAEGVKMAEASSVLRHMDSRMRELREWIDRKTEVSVPVKFADRIGGTHGRRHD